MLVLTRSWNESVFMIMPDGRRIEVTIVEMRNGKVKLGFDAPRDVRIIRDDAIDRTEQNSQ